MNQIVNKFFLTGEKFMSGIHLRQPGFTYKEFCKQEIQIIPTRMNWIKLAVNMIWLMANKRRTKKNTIT